MAFTIAAFKPSQTKVDGSQTLTTDWKVAGGILGSPERREYPLGSNRLLTGGDNQPENMARRSQRLSSTFQATPTASHKRAASNTASSNAEAKRTKAAKVTPTKSQYFKETKGAEASASDSEDVATSSEDEEASEFGDESKETTSSEGGDDDYDQDSDDDPKSRRKAKPTKAQTSSPAIRTKDSELWREGVKTGLGPGTQVIIKKPKARPAGSTPYRDETIHPNTLLFLKDLKANNERQWLKSKSAFFCAT